MKNVFNKVWNFMRNPLGYVMIACGCLVAAAAAMGVCRADDISDATTSVSGYEVAGVAVGVAILLFTLGRKVLRRVICIVMPFALAGMSFSAHATGDDITTVTTSVSGYETAGVGVGVAILLFVLGRKVLRRVI